MSLSINNNSMLSINNYLTQAMAAANTAQTQISTGKKINSASDDPAGYVLSVGLQTQINGLTQGTSNANDAISMVQTAGSSLSQILSTLQSMQASAQKATSGTISSSSAQSIQAALTQSVQQINSLIQSSTYNGINLLNGSAGLLNIQVGAQVGQSVQVNLSQGISAASLGQGTPQSGSILGTISNLNLTSAGAVNTSGAAGAITSVNIVANGSGGVTFTDQNNNTLSTTAVSALFTQTQSGAYTQIAVAGTSALNAANASTTIAAAPAATAAGYNYGTITGLNLDATTGSNTISSGDATITSISVVSSDGSGDVQYLDQNGNQINATAAAQIFGATSTYALTNVKNGHWGSVNQYSTSITAANTLNSASSLSALTVTGSTAAAQQNNANQALLTIQNAISTITSMQANMGALTNRFTSIVTAQTAMTTNLTTAQTNLTGADVAQAQANYTAAQTQQQIDVALMAQANSNSSLVLALIKG
jgi:flagellin